MAQGAVQRPVFVFTTAADRVAGGNQEIQAGLVQFRNKAPLENADRIVDVADYRKADTFAGWCALVDSLHLLAVQGFEILLEEIQVHLVADQGHDNYQAQVKQEFQRVSSGHDTLRWLLISSLCITSRPISIPR